ncbi:hypothetical protein GTA08_BOTSDO14154 [Botryosphaeria dothidea]|uniref:Cytochrome P450 n=1 Tax=Botryosphaeria dothidea TaxID=55169 RepID=A0A8H4N829_9PEZI|nr:hypothetical protein GTA08_BOTSDO14154 [Botryosphaeria dothidea]
MSDHQEPSPPSTNAAADARMIEFAWHAPPSENGSHAQRRNGSQPPSLEQASQRPSRSLRILTTMRLSSTSSKSKIVRVAPNELHIADPHSYKVYPQDAPPPKLERFYTAFPSLNTVFSETDLSKHRERRKLMNPLFSKAMALKLEPLIWERMSLLFKKIDGLSVRGPINFMDATRCMTADIMTQLLFWKPLELTHESEDSFYASFLALLDSSIDVPQWLYFQGWLRAIYTYTPFLIPLLAESCLQEYKENPASSRYPVLFDHLQSIPADQQISEGVSTLIAGSDTTAITTGFAIVSPATRRDGVSACVREGGSPTRDARTGRHPRVFPENGQPLIIDGKLIPPGASIIHPIFSTEQELTFSQTIIGASAYSVHMDESIWGPNAESFIPERWLGGDKMKELDKHLLTFSKGARACIGINLAHAEVFYMLA